MVKNSLPHRTRELLRADPRNYREISAQSGLPYGWVKSFGKRGRDAMSGRVQALWEFLTGSPLLP